MHSMNIIYSKTSKETGNKIHTELKNFPLLIIFIIRSIEMRASKVFYMDQKWSLWNINGMV